MVMLYEDGSLFNSTFQWKCFDDAGLDKLTKDDDQTFWLDEMIPSMGFELELVLR